MPIGSTTVGSNAVLQIVQADPNSANKIASVLGLADATSLAGLYAALMQNIPLLLNSAGTFDRQRSAIGAAGIPAVSIEGSKATYSAAAIAFTPAATATDFWQILGSGTKTGRLLQLTVTGFATSAISVDIQLIKRTTASTGTTPTAAGIGQHDSNDAAPTCVVNTFAANGTLGTGAGVVRAQKLNLGATGAAGKVSWDFSTRNSKGLMLRGIAEQYALNFNGAAVPSGMVIDIECEFSEE